jgi:ribosomal protein S18 acetylase RimI-like enzyme
MQALPTIRDGHRTDLETLVDILSDAFSRDPMLNWTIPLRKLHPTFFRLIIKDVYLPHGVVHLDARGRGAALWLRPDQRFEMPQRLALMGMLLELLLRRGPAPLVRMQRQGALFARQHPREPHFYLQFIGCRQMAQGRGVGSALLRQGTRMCDRKQLPAYLESSNLDNVSLYRRHGFEVIHRQAVPGKGPTAWFMWREPR